MALIASHVFVLFRNWILSCRFKLVLGLIRHEISAVLLLLNLFVLLRGMTLFLIWCRIIVASLARQFLLWRESLVQLLNNSMLISWSMWTVDSLHVQPRWAILKQHFGANSLLEVLLWHMLRHIMLPLGLKLWRPIILHFLAISAPIMTRKLC